MKKLLGIIVLGLLWCNVSFALTLSGINRLDVSVEQMDEPSMRKCKITYRDIETEAKYLISNVNIKIMNSDIRKTTQIMFPTFYIGGTIFTDGTRCIGGLVIQVQHASLVDPLNKGNAGVFLYFQRNASMSAGVDGFKDYYLGFVKSLTKELIIEWNKFNK